jgi:hypothetical protein
MALPWLAALRVIPWGAIVENAPAIARSAHALLARTTTPRSRADSPAETHRLLAERVEALEKRDRETVELLTRVTDQLADMAAATEMLAARARWLLVIAVAALILALVASGLAVWLR